MQEKALVTTGFNVYDPTCPARQVLGHLTSRWGVLVLGALQERTYRFAELSRRIGGVSEKMLAQTLRLLERDGLVHRVSYPEVPPRVEYSLTNKGYEAAALTTALVGWVELHARAVLDSQIRHDTGSKVE